MSREDWEIKFVEALVAKDVSLILAKILVKVVPHYDNKETPEKAAEIEFNRLYR